MNLTVIVDSREKRPLLFPSHLKCTDISGVSRLLSVKVKVAPLQSGDYILEGYEKQVIVERKGTQRELYNNFFTGDKKRQGRAFARLAKSCVHPTLLLEMTPTQLLAASPHVPAPDRLFTCLCGAVSKFNFHLLWWPCNRSVPDRRRLGKCLLYYLKGCIDA